MFNVCLRHKQTFYCGLTVVSGVVHDYGLCAMVKISQVGDLDARANLLFN